VVLADQVAMKVDIEEGFHRAETGAMGRSCSLRSE
jgi:hypothetical protein